MLVHRHHLRAGHELEPGKTVKERLHGGRKSHQEQLQPVLASGFGGAGDDLGGRVVTAHPIDSYAQDVTSSGPSGKTVDNPSARTRRAPSGR